ncbi:hypothetical protein [Peribacillus frigoritolerans]|uniref:hypothetical protein n=1 Tax=Peribacillus frigoritolerans TaxID=450367 RepID=UPI00105987A7|nr:hypothetical protein [Peribacillus frigoritolerans]TDL80491.1 hypothetical protein E2R53_10765 [Peribacillus frigoritolerans]
MENKELLLAITELKASIDKRFDVLEKQVDVRLDKVEEQLYKLSKQGLGDGDDDQDEPLRELNAEVKDLRLSMKYALKKIGEHDFDVYRLLNMKNDTSEI